MQEENEKITKMLMNCVTIKLENLIRYLNFNNILTCIDKGNI